MDRTPLLTAVDGLPGPNIMQDHPAFLRACHSPWRWIPQNVLVIFRGIVLAFIIATGVMIIDYKLSEECEFTKWGYLFDFAIVSYILLFLYHLITFCWTFTHLYYPHLEDCEGGIESWIVAAMSLPRHMASLRKQFHFTLFYTVAVVFAFMNSIIYWFITLQRDEGDSSEGEGEDVELYSFGSRKGLMTSPDAPISDILGEGWFDVYIIIALYAIPSAIMVFEIFWLNSIKRPIWIGSHVFGLIFIAGLYLAWATLGIYLTGMYPFFWLDETEVGSKEAVTAYCIGFVLLAPIMYVLMQGFVAVREGLTRSRAEARAVIAVQEALES